MGYLQRTVTQNQVIIMSSNHALARFGYYPDLKDEEELSWGAWVSPNRGALQIVFKSNFFLSI